MALPGREGGVRIKARAEANLKGRAMPRRNDSADGVPGISAANDTPRSRCLADILPESLAPRGLSRAQAAAYVGVSPSLFDEMAADGRMPGPKRINSRVVWDKIRLDAAFEALPDDQARNSWDEIAAPHQVDTDMPAALALECLEHHIVTHPNADARERFQAMRDQIVMLAPDHPVAFNLK
jgi:predicted DNA-binding transcriptional regulator AlpA